MNEPDYLLIVANRYLALRGSLTASSLDIAQILAWEAEGIPLSAALAGIEEAFVAIAPDKPRTISACYAYVQRARRSLANPSPVLTDNDESLNDAGDEENKLEKLWQESNEEDKNRMLRQARAILCEDCKRMSPRAAQDTILLLAMKLLFLQHQANNYQL